MEKIRRTALVAGVANGRSLAWFSAISLLKKGYDVIITYQNDRFEPTVKKMVESYQKEQIKSGNGIRKCGGFLKYLPCDVSCDNSIRTLMTEDVPKVLHESSKTERIDAIVHSIAHAPPESMKQSSSSTTNTNEPSLQLVGTSRSAFQTTHDVSSYSLIALTQHALPYLTTVTTTTDTDTSSVTALTYLGSTRAAPHYNVMGPAKASLEAVVRGLASELGPAHGVRVNAVSAGPVNTLAARGVQDFTNLKQRTAENAPLRRNANPEEVADVVAYLSHGEEGAGAITGQVVYVDGGFSSVVAV